MSIATNPSGYRGIQEAESTALFDRASRCFVGGVSAAGPRNPRRGRPDDITPGGRCRQPAVDGHEYIDFSSSNGSSMLGFNHPRLTAAVRQALAMGTITTQETEHHVRLGERLTQIIPGAEKVRFSNTGTEATMAAIRIARAATGRDKIVKFDGHFHGMHDYVLYNAHSPEQGYQSLVPNDRDSKGIPAALDDLLYTIPFNDAEAVDKLFAVHGDEIAAVILEPVSFNQGCVPSNRDWLVHLREVTERHGTALIFDEVLSGFRFALGSAAEYYGVTPDLSAWAKALAAGWPLAAVTGREWVMSALNPVGGAVVSGTYTGHLAAVLAAHAALDVMSEPDFYPTLHRRANRFYGGIDSSLSKHGVPGHVQGLGARFGIYFGLTEEVTDYRSARRFDKNLNNQFLRLTAPHGLHFHDFGTKAAPMHYGITAAHTDADLDEALARIDHIIGQLG